MTIEEIKQQAEQLIVEILSELQTKTKMAVTDIRRVRITDADIADAMTDPIIIDIHLSYHK